MQGIIAGMEQLPVGQGVYKQLRQLEFELSRLSSSIDVGEHDRTALKALESLRRTLRNTQILARDYGQSEVEEDTRGQLKVLPRLVQGIEQLRAGILKVSEYNMISAVDVAQSTAQLDLLLAGLR